MIPEINIKFKEYSANPIKLTPKGHVVLILKDTTLSNDIVVFNKMTEIDGVSEDNKKYISDVFVGGARKVTVLNIKGVHTIDSCIKDLDNLQYDYVGVLSNNTEEHTKLSTYIKAQDKALKTVKAVTYNISNQNCKHIINLINTKLTFNDSRGEKTGDKAVPLILGILAGMPFSRGATNYFIGELKSVVNVSDVKAEVEKGNLVLNYNGEDVRIIAGVNTLVNVDADNTESMKSILIVEAMDLMRQDIQKSLNTYIGAYKNNYQNQMLIVSSVKGYFNKLEELEILDNEYNNSVDLDTDKMANYWTEQGKTNIANLPIAELRTKSCGKFVFLKADIKMLEVIEHFDFKILLTV